MADTIHIVFGGATLCGQGVPDDDGGWVGYGTHDSATCRDCLIEARITDAVSTGLREHQEHALLQLLRRAVAWRTQGHISAWKTPPSRALALEVDKLFETLPALVAAVAPERWAQHKAAFGEAEERPALPPKKEAPIDGEFIAVDYTTTPTLMLSQWSLAVSARWGRVLGFAAWVAPLAGAELERVELTDAEATLHLRLGAHDVRHVVAWAQVETGFEEGWRAGIAAAIRQLQQAQPTGA